MKFEAAFVLDNAGWPALLVDAEGNLRRANTAAAAVLGNAVQGECRLGAIWAEENTESPDQFLSHWERTQTPTVTLKLRGKGGATLTCLTSICSFSIDGRKYFTLQLSPSHLDQPPATEAAGVHKQKLDCALQLARTVALDFNNALTGILGHTSLLLSKMEPGHPMRESLLEVEKSAEKAAEIAHDLGTFSRQEKQARAQKANNLNQLLASSIDVIRASQSKEIKWTLQMERQLYATSFDEAKMQQAIIKILENAIEAIRDYGTITVSTRNLELNEPTQDRNARLEPGYYVCAEFSDTGIGIEASDLPRIFEPFFTTKRGNHRGLGLAWVYGIVTNHGGGVAVSSESGRGTSVRVYLPAEKRFVQSQHLPLEELQGAETILMVDDEEMLLTMGRTVLSSFGYKVMTANSGHKALDIISAAREPIHLMITDMVMPNMGGRELVEQVQKVAPTIRILCASGFVRPGSDEKRASFLKKPFTTQQLLQKVREILSINHQT